MNCKTKQTLFFFLIIFVEVTYLKYKTYINYFAFKYVEKYLLLLFSNMCPFLNPHPN